MTNPSNRIFEEIEARADRLVEKRASSMRWALWKMFGNGGGFGMGAVLLVTSLRARWFWTAAIDGLFMLVMWVWALGIAHRYLKSFDKAGMREMVARIGRRRAQSRRRR